MNMSRWRVCELWMAVCVVCGCGAAGFGAPSVATVTVLVALSLVPVASVMRWWPSDVAVPTLGAASARA